MPNSQSPRLLMSFLHKMSNRLTQTHAAQVRASDSTPANTDPTTLATGVHTDDGGTRDMMELNGPKGLPLVGNFWTYLKKKNRGRMHEVQAELHQQFGPVFREKWGPKWQLHVCDPELIEEVYRTDRKYPHRPPLRSWQLYQKHNGLPGGLVTSDGEEWLKVRQVLNKQMLRPKSVAANTQTFVDITEELIRRLTITRDQGGDEHLSKTLLEFFNRWAIECVGEVTFSARLGALRDPAPESTQEFINAIVDMHRTGLVILVGEQLHYKLNTVFWRKHAAAWDKIFQIASHYVNEKMMQIQAGADSRQSDDSTNLLTYLLANEKLTSKDVYVNVTEILLSGVDTTSNCLSFTLHLLARNPSVQSRLYQEVASVAGLSGHLKTELFEQMPYLRAAIKESLRLFPIATMNVRTMEQDSVIGGYRVPKDTMCVLNHYAASRNGAYFEDPDEFRPERWLRDDNNKTDHNAFAALPFGFGSRSCIGKRLAFLELSIALVKMMQRFSVEPTGAELKPYLRTLLTPGDVVPVRFVDRQ